MYENIADTNGYILYLEHLKIDTKELKNEIQKEIKNKQNIFEKFWSRINELMSPNINLDNIIFEKANNYIYEHFWDEFQFDITFKLDMQSLIASKNSLIERPNIKKPTEIENGTVEEIRSIKNYVQIARFEIELVLDGYVRNNKRQHIVFQGLTPISGKNPFFEYLPSSLIWKNQFYYPDKERIIGLYKNSNSIEARYILWINSVILDKLGLKFDDYNNGLRALNKEGDVILEFRCWRDELIDNGASFVGIDSNIAKLEGCDLMLREDYFEKLGNIRFGLNFYTHKAIYNFNVIDKP